MLTNFYAVRHFLISLRIAAGRELEAPLELLVDWPFGVQDDVALA